MGGICQFWTVPTSEPSITECIEPFMLYLVQSSSKRPQECPLKNSWVYNIYIRQKIVFMWKFHVFQKPQISINSKEICMCDSLTSDFEPNPILNHFEELWRFSDPSDIYIRLWRVLKIKNTKISIFNFSHKQAIVKNVSNQNLILW